MTHTPTTHEALTRYDRLPPAQAVLLAWTNPGPHPDWHTKMQERLRLEMPLLAHNLDRLAQETP